MSQMLDLDDFPIGTLARTPSGRIGIVIKHKGAASKQDHFQRLVLHFSSDPHDSVTLQPNMLDPITPCTSGRALTATAREFWASEDGETLMQKMRNRQEFTVVNKRTMTAQPVLDAQGRTVQAGVATAKPLTEQQAKANMFGARMYESNNILNELETAGVTRPEGACDGQAR